VKNYKVRLGIVIGLVAIFVLPAMDKKNRSEDDLSSLESQSSIARKRINGNGNEKRAIPEAINRGIIMHDVVSDQPHYYWFNLQENGDLSIKYKHVEIQDAQEGTCCTMNLYATASILLGCCLCCSKR
jgi:hypothetical protein